MLIYLVAATSKPRLFAEVAARWRAGCADRGGGAWGNKAPRVGQRGRYSRLSGRWGDLPEHEPHGDRGPNR